MLNECIRHMLLLQLEAAYPISLPIDTLKQGLLLSGFKIQHLFLQKELAYLHDKGFLSLVHNELCPQNHRYKLSTKGIDFLENEKRNSNGL